MARPKEYQDGRVAMALRVPQDMHERLRAASVERDLSVNWLVCRAIEEFLDNLLPVSEMVFTRRKQSPPLTFPIQPDQTIPPPPWQPTAVHSASSLTRMDDPYKGSANGGEG